MQKKSGLTIITYHEFLAKLKGEEKWEPKNGEEVEVSGSDKKWHVRRFVVLHCGAYYCEMQSDKSSLSRWNFCRPLRPTITHAEAEQILGKRIVD